MLIHFVGCKIILSYIIPASKRSIFQKDVVLKFYSYDDIRGNMSHKNHRLP
jgi:hypothetical protein